MWATNSYFVRMCIFFFVSRSLFLLFSGCSSAFRLFPLANFPFYSFILFYYILFSTILWNFLRLSPCLWRGCGLVACARCACVKSLAHCILYAIIKFRAILLCAIIMFMAILYNAQEIAQCVCVSHTVDRQSWKIRMHDMPSATHPSLPHSRRNTEKWPKASITSDYDWLVCSECPCVLFFFKHLVLVGMDGLIHAPLPPCDDEPVTVWLCDPTETGFAIRSPKWPKIRFSLSQNWCYRHTMHTQWGGEPTCPTAEHSSKVIMELCSTYKARNNVTLALTSTQTHTE